MSGVETRASGSGRTCASYPGGRAMARPVGIRRRSPGFSVTGAEPFTVERGLRIAQLVVAAHATVAWTVAESLDDTARGAGGFGSTGTAKIA